MENNDLNLFVTQWQTMASGANLALMQAFDNLSTQDKQWVAKEVGKQVLDPHQYKLLMQTFEQETNQEANSLLNELNELKKEIIIRVAKDFQPA